MGRNSNGVRGGGSARTQTAEKYNNDLGVTTDSIKSAIMSNSQTPFRTNQGSIERMMSAQTQGLIEDIAKGDYGLATTIAKQAVERSGWNQYGARFSDKQAYILAKAAYDNKLISPQDANRVFRDVSKEVERDRQRKNANRRASRAAKAAAQKQIANNTAKNSSLSVGATVRHAQFGSGKIVSMDTNTIEVDFGGTRKKMMKAFVKFS